MKLVWKIVGWVISVFLLLMALVFLFGGSFRSFFTGALFLIGALATNPLCISLIERYTGFSLKKRFIGLIAAVTFFAGVFVAPPAESTPTEEAIVSETEKNISSEEEIAKAQGEKDAEMKAKAEDEVEVAMRTELENQQKAEVQKMADVTVSTPTPAPTPTPVPTPDPTPIPVETPKFYVNDISSTMYASSNVNVRSAPDTNETKLGSLTKDQKVSVTGQTDNGWYRIDYGGSAGFVKGEFLTDEKKNTDLDQKTDSGLNTVGTVAATVDNAVSTKNNVETTYSGSYVVNGKNGKIHANGKCAATDPTTQSFMDIPIYFDTYDEALAYSQMNFPKQNKPKCGFCWK